MAINRGTRASSQVTPSHFMATLSLPPTRPLHFPHKHTLAQGSFGRSSIDRPPVLSLFVRSSDRPIVHGSFVRSFIVPIHRSSFVHTTIHHHYSPLLFISVTIHGHYSPSLLFTDTIRHRYCLSMISIVTFCHHYSLLLFIITIHRSSDHPKFQLLIHHAVQSS
jgi:hypothetical protein